MSGKPFTWNEYDQGRQRQGSTGSVGSGRIQFVDDATTTEHEGPDSRVRRERERSLAGVSRRSSIGAAMNQIAHVGGLNSIENFARSWQRAAGFHEIAPSRGSFAIASEDDLLDDHLRPPDEERRIKPRPSLLRHQIQQYGSPPESAVQDAPGETTDDLLDPTMPLLSQSPSRGVFASPFSSSFTAGAYGSFPSPVDMERRQSATKAFIDRATEEADGPEKDMDAAPLLIHHVEQPDGKISIEVIGQSTIYQTILNSTNVLIGVGILSLPLGIRYAGWVMGAAMLTLAAITTGYTAKLLGRCLDIDRSIITYSDIALFAYGKFAEIGIGLVFTFELLTACVALVVLFGDTLHLLVPTFGVIEWEILAGLISIPLAFVPLRYLGITSMLGIVCCFSIVILVLAAGLTKHDSPGSLIDPAATYLFPQHWSTLPLSLGLLMSPWGGHAVFPQFYRDMRHPHKYGKAVGVTFSLTYTLNGAIAVIGLLMFGDETRAEVTSNILGTKGYPKILSLLLIICIAIIPITKLPLNAQPIFHIVETLLRIRNPESDEDGKPVRSKFARRVLYVGSRIGIIAVITAIAIVCPGFDRVMSLMGSLFCMIICICCPVAFYLKLYNDKIGTMERVGLWAMGTIALVLAAIGTVWAFLPPEITKAKG